MRRCYAGASRLHTERRAAPAAIIVREMGKAHHDALGQVDFSAAIYEFYADRAGELLAALRRHKRSGFGRELGRYGIEEFVNKKMIRTVR